MGVCVSLPPCRIGITTHPMGACTKRRRERPCPDFRPPPPGRWRRALPSTRSVRSMSSAPAACRRPSWSINPSVRRSRSVGRSAAAASCSAASRAAHAAAASRPPPRRRQPPPKPKLVEKLPGGETHGRGNGPWLSTTAKDDHDGAAGGMAGAGVGEGVGEGAAPLLQVRHPPQRRRVRVWPFAFSPWETGHRWRGRSVE